MIGIVREPHTHKKSSNKQPEKHRTLNKYIIHACMLVSMMNFVLVVAGCTLLYVRGNMFALRWIVLVQAIGMSPKPSTTRDWINVLIGNVVSGQIILPRQLICDEHGGQCQDELQQSPASKAAIGPGCR